ncbi:MAG: mannose-1-phosphate guanylyltransferase/mannose-6-phosphate isomerase, partial [Burkholderiales bacterium]
MNPPALQHELGNPMQVNANRYAVVLAGGSGTRLWPLSRTSMPKQLLPLNGAETLLQQTVRRLLPLVEPCRIITVTSSDLRFEVAGQLHAVHPDLVNGVLAEPVGRNTLPAIAWATAKIAQQCHDALIGVFSSDHAVADADSFHRAWICAESSATDGYITLFGMQPTEPATGYGYIRTGDALTPQRTVQGSPYTAYQVARFVEKPDSNSATRYLEEGGYYWNGGMFVFKADCFAAALEQYQPALHKATQALADATLAPLEVYAKLPNISIDYGLLELCDKAAVVPVQMGWSDLGSWEAIYQQRDKDADGNLLEGEVVAVNSHDNLLWSEHGMLATLGLSNIAVVQTRDATLVCPRDQVEDLKRLVAAVRDKHPALTEFHVTVARPWGSYTVLEEGAHYKIKRIKVNPGSKLSLQMHHHRSEHWVVIDGTARITNGDQEIYLQEDESTFIPKTHRHRLENPGKIPLQIIEI